MRIIYETIDSMLSDVSEALSSLDCVSIHYKDGKVVVKQDLTDLMKKLSVNSVSSVPLSMTIRHRSRINRVANILYLGRSGIGNMVKLSIDGTIYYVTYEINIYKVFLLDKAKQLGYRKLGSDALSALKNLIEVFLKKGDYQVQKEDIKFKSKDGCVLAELCVSKSDFGYLSDDLNIVANSMSIGDAVFIDKKPYIDNYKCYLRVCVVE